MDDLALELITEGKKLGIPKQAIDYVIGKLHVGTSDDEVAKYLTDRIGKAKVQWPANAVKAAVEHGLSTHRKNQDLYGQVMSGNIGNKKPRKKKDEVEVKESILDDFEEPKNDYYDLIQATISGKPVDFKDAFNRIIGPKVVDAVYDMKESIKRTMYTEEVVQEPIVNTESVNILSTFAKKVK